MKKDIVTKMIAIGGIGLTVIVASVVIILLLSGSGDTSPSKPDTSEGSQPGQTEDESQEPVEEEKTDMTRILALIKEVTEGQVRVYNVANGHLVTLEVTGTVDIKSAYGEPLALNQIEPGNMMEIKYDRLSARPESMQISGRVWERSDSENMLINENASTIQIANDIYNYNEALVIYDRGRETKITDLSSADDLVFRGYKDYIWSITVEGGHGFILLKNEASYVGGTLEISNRKTMTVTEGMQIPVTSGVHKIVIRNEGMAPYSGELFVGEKEEVVIDLGDFQPKIGKVDFVLVQEDAQLFINDKLQVDLSEPLVLDYGTYSLRLEKEGYVPLEKELEVAEAYQNVLLDLELEPQYLEIQTPESAEVYIDGRFVGTIPLKTKIQPAYYTITIRKEGFKTRSIDVQIEDNGKDNLFSFPDLEPVQDLKDEPDPEEEAPSEETPSEDVYNN